jgi:hypothetical protein
MQTKRTVVLLGLGLMLGRLTTEIPSVKAQAASGCSAQTLSGPYTYALSGSYFASGSQYGFSSAGIMVADGGGAFTGTDTVSDGAVITRGRKYTGAYNVNSDCTGTLILQVSGAALHLDIVITNNARNVNFIQTDGGTNIAGTAQQQFPSQ